MRSLIALALAALLVGCGAHNAYERKDGVWRYAQVVVDVPAGEALTPLNDSFASSATRAWYRATPIEGADGKTFEALDRHYAKDSAHGWYAETYRVGQDYFTTERVRIGVLDGANAANL
ncbi:MAG: hypothetical protein ACHP7N_11520, partial [Caulobacterales bacterium]